MAARTRQLAQMAQQLMQLAGERDVAVGAGAWAGSCCRSSGMHDAPCHAIAMPCHAMLSPCHRHAMPCLAHDHALHSAACRAMMPISMPWPCRRRALSCHACCYSWSPAQCPDEKRTSP